MSFDDPFEIDQTETSAPEAEVKPTVIKSPAVGDGEGKIVSTYKEGGNYDASWTVVHANSVSDWFAIHDDPRFKELLDKQKKVAHYMRGGVAGQIVSSGGSGAAPAASQGAPSWAPEKPFADFVYKSGVSAKTGKPWHAWMAPTRGDSRPALFFYPN